MSAPEPTTEQMPKSELTKEQLERKKIELEIKDLERPFWKRPVYVLAALPTLLAVVTLSVGLFDGYFSAALTKLENQKFAVETQIKEFKVEADALHIENDRLRKENASVEEKIATIKQGYDTQLLELVAKRGEVQQQYDKLNASFETLKRNHEELSRKTGQLTQNAKVLAQQKSNLDKQLEETRVDLNKMLTLTQELDNANITSMSEGEKDKFKQLLTIAGKVNRVRVVDIDRFIRMPVQRPTKQK